MPVYQWSPSPHDTHPTIWCFGLYITGDLGHRKAKRGWGQLRFSVITRWRVEGSKPLGIQSAVRNGGTERT